MPRPLVPISGLAGEARLGLSHARHLLLVGEGAEGIEALAGQERWRATYQLDWWHLRHALHRTFPDQPTLVAPLQQALYQGQGERLVRLVQDCRALGVGDPERVARLEGYLRSKRGGFYGARHLREHLSPQARLVAVEGSGAIEKQMELVGGRRFKGQGMSPEATLAAAGPERGRSGCSNCGYGSGTQPPNPEVGTKGS